jgi:glycosyltransferase involved in cell wall biosynthesis
VIGNRRPFSDASGSDATGASGKEVAVRICLVSQEYPPETAHGGIGAQTYIKAHGLARLGHDVHVISHSLDGVRRRRRDGLVDVTRIPGADARLTIRGEATRWLTYSVEVAIALEDLLASTPIDIVDFPEWAGEGYVHLVNRPQGSRPAAVLHLHGPLVMFGQRLGWPDRDSEFYRLGTVMEGACFRLADAVFSSSRCSASWCMEEYGPREQPIPVMHTGVDRSLFRPLQVPRDGRPTILFVGKIARNKGVVQLVDTALSLAEEWPDLRLRLIGRGDENLRRSLEARALAGGRRDLLEMPGPMSRDDLPAEFAKADLFAAPSEYEGGPGFVYLEAMACGIPVIACAGSGSSEVVQDEENGLLVPPNDAGALRQALARMLADADLRKRLAARGLQYVAEEADSEVCLRRIETFYETVIASRQAAAA